MKELMNGLGKRVNEVAGQIGKKTEPIVKKTEEMVEIQKVKSQIRDLENHNEYDLCDLGEIVFAKYKDELVQDEDFVAICEEIEQRLEAIENLELRIAELKGVEICKNCEMVLPKGVSYCSNCGAKVERPVIKVDEIEKEDIEEATIFEEGDVVEIIETEDQEVEIEFVVEPIVEIEVEVAEKEEVTEEVAEEVAEKEEATEEVEEEAATEEVAEEVEAAEEIK